MIYFEKKLNCSKLAFHIEKKQPIDKDPIVADVAELELGPTKCAYCGLDQMEYIMRCVGCERNESAAIYCSSRCQKADWKQHKKVCSRLDKKRKSETSL